MMDNGNNSNTKYQDVEKEVRKEKQGEKISYNDEQDNKDHYHNLDQTKKEEPQQGLRSTASAPAALVPETVSETVSETASKSVSALELSAFSASVEEPVSSQKSTELTATAEASLSSTNQLQATKNPQNKKKGSGEEQEQHNKKDLSEPLLMKKSQQDDSFVATKNSGNGRTFEESEESAGRAKPAVKFRSRRKNRPKSVDRSSGNTKSISKRPRQQKKHRHRKRTSSESPAHFSEKEQLSDHEKSHPLTGSLSYCQSCRKSVSNCMNCLARMVVWSSVAALVGAVFWYSYELKNNGKDPHLIAWFSAGAFVILGFPISMWGIISHLANYNQPHIQCYVVRILWMVPVYSIQSWLCLRFHQYAIYIETLRDFYESFVLYCFTQYLIEVLGGEQALILMMKDKSPTRGHHMWGFQWCMKPWVMGMPIRRTYYKSNENSNGSVTMTTTNRATTKRVIWTSPFFISCKFGVLQYVLLKFVCSIFVMLLELNGLYQEGNFKYSGGYLYICIITNISQCWALYCLIIFYYATHTELAPIRPIGKFLSVKALVFFTWWQSVAISVVQYYITIPHYYGGTEKPNDSDFMNGVGIEDYEMETMIHEDESFYWKEDDIAKGIQNYLICIEMFVAAIVHSFVFPHGEFSPQAIRARARAFSPVAPLYPKVRKKKNLKSFRVERTSSFQKAVVSMSPPRGSSAVFMRSNRRGVIADDNNNANNNSNEIALGANEYKNMDETQNGTRLGRQYQNSFLSQSYNNNNNKEDNSNYSDGITISGDTANSSYLELTNVSPSHTWEEATNNKKSYYDNENEISDNDRNDNSDDWSSLLLTRQQQQEDEATNEKIPFIQQQDEDNYVDDQRVFAGHNFEDEGDHAEYLHDNEKYDEEANNWSSVEGDSNDEDYDSREEDYSSVDNDYHEDDDALDEEQEQQKRPTNFVSALSHVLMPNELLENTVGMVKGEYVIEKKTLLHHAATSDSYDLFSSTRRARRSMLQNTPTASGVPGRIRRRTLSNDESFLSGFSSDNSNDEII